MASRLPPSERERVVLQLGEHFARDHLSLEEYERRVTDAYRAADHAALVALTRDLPALAAQAPVAVAPVVAPARARKRIVAFMAGVVRRGVWVVPAQVTAVAVMGGVELDLSEATWTADAIDVYAAAVMGGIVVAVPPGVRVEADGLAILGGFEDQLEQAGSRDPDAPVLRLRGFAFMGGVEVKVKAKEEGGAQDGAKS